MHNLRFIKILLFFCLVLFVIHFFYGNPQTNLQRFQDLTKNDPLFFDPSTDVTFLKKSLRRLREKNEEVISIHSKFRKSLPQESQTVLPKGWRLWPDNFLTTLPKIHEDTNNFLQNPTRKNGLILLTDYETAVKAYKKAADLNVQAINNIFNSSPELKDRIIVFLGSATTPEIIYNDFLLIQKNANTLVKQVQQRKNCLSIGVCPTAQTLINSQKEIEDIPSNPLSLDILGVEENETLSGPFKSATNCFGTPGNNKVFNQSFFVKVRRDKDGDIFLKPMLSNTKYYKDFREIPDEQTSQIYLKQGISIKPHSEVNDYLCTDLRYIPDLITQYLEQEKKLTDPISHQSKLASLPYLINHTLSFSNFVTYYPQFSQKSLDPLYLLTDRSSYSLYFGTFTPTIWRLNKSPIFLLDEDFRQQSLKSGFKQYQDLINEGLSDEEIKKLNTLPKFDDVFTPNNLLQLE